MPDPRYPLYRGPEGPRQPIAPVSPEGGVTFEDTPASTFDQLNERERRTKPVRDRRVAAQEPAPENRPLAAASIETATEDEVPSPDDAVVEGAPPPPPGGAGNEPPHHPRNTPPAAHHDDHDHHKTPIQQVFSGLWGLFGVVLNWSWITIKGTVGNLGKALNLKASGGGHAPKKHDDHGKKGHDDHGHGAKAAAGHH